MGEPSIEKLARALGVSARSLHRALKKESATYRAILEDIRKHLAIEYLKKKKCSIIEVAFQLGYSDSGHFTRAFKRWYRISPTRFRETKEFVSQDNRY
ncbi:MAG: helix-turn-helix transcriptional regulator [Proteobacteria bacterium]|nr:helix-turn-helix transcriptional regulator [Pseudomonadota bacterium]